MAKRKLGVSRRKSRRRANMGMCGCEKAEMGMCGKAYAEMGVKRGMVQLKVGSMKLLLNKNLGTIYRASDEKYLGKLRKTAKGVYFMNNGKRVYLSDKVAKVMGAGKPKSRKARTSKRKSRKRKSRKRKSRKRKSRKRKSRKRKSRKRKSRKRKSRKRKSRKRKSRKRKSRKSKSRKRKSRKRKSRKRKSRKRKSRKRKSRKRKSRKRKSRKRKSRKRKSRKRKSRKRKSRKRKSRKAKAVNKSRNCVRQTDKKYTSRPSPSYPANECCGKEMEGNDGRLYVSKRDKHGVCRWKLA